MTCPVCSGKTGVFDTASDDVEAVYRMRRCKNCGYEFYTVERECDEKGIKQMYNAMRNKRIYDNRDKRKLQLNK